MSRPRAARVPVLDRSQAAARDAILASGHHVVNGAPGTGKTQTALAAFTAALGSQNLGEAVLLVPTRQRAALVRDEVARRLDRTTGSILVRTPASLAFSILRLRASHLGEPAPTLITGPEQDQVLAELIAGHLEGEGTTIEWPDAVGRATLGLRAFRDELRELLMRAAEAGLDGAELARWGEQHERPEWRAAGQLLAEYTDVTLLGQLTPDRGARYDAATIVDEAVLALRTWERTVGAHPRPRWSFVVHDDYQDATLATARLLDAMVDDGARLALFGDPDVAVQAFRGGVPALMHTATLPAGRQVGAWEARSHVLSQVWRHPEGLRRVIRELSDTLPTMQEIDRRRAQARDDGAGVSPSVDAAPVRTVVLASPAQEVAYIARALREHHLHARVPWSAMAVIVRSGAELGAIRRGLRTAGVPLTMAAPDRPLREEPGVRPLLVALACVLSPRVGPEAGTELLLSPLGGLDAVSLRSLRRVLRQEERATGGERHSDDLLGEALVDPARTATLPPRYRRAPQAVARVLAAGRAALDEEGSSVETVLWAMWEATRLAPTWQKRALAGGAAADRADADLDAVMALFRAAEQFVDRTARSTPAGFLEHLAAQDFPADTLAARGELGDTVAVHTPASAAGEEWDVVVVAGVQEDTWPDLRIRDTILGAAELADIATARHVALSREAGPARLDRYRRARREVYEGELRTFVMACSRARGRLILTSVLDTDSRPSAFFDHVLPDTDELPVITRVPASLDLRGLVGQLRASLRPLLQSGSGAGAGAVAVEDVAEARDAARVLVHLSVRNVDGADPALWPVHHVPSSAGSLWSEDEAVTVTPSAVETAATCPLRWVLTTSGGRTGSSSAQNLGNLVHDIAAQYPDGTETELLAVLDARWHELDLDDGWLGRRERARGERMVRKLAGYLASTPHGAQTEVAFEAILGRVALRGRVDRVERHADGGVEIVDLKTGSTPISAAEAERHPQLGSYQVATAHGAFGEGAPAGASLVYLGSPTKAFATRSQGSPAGDPDPQWAERLLTETAETMAGASFEARPGPGCRHCPVRSSCPAQPEGGRVVRHD